MFFSFLESVAFFSWSLRREWHGRERRIKIKRNRKRERQSSVTSYARIFESALVKERWCVEPSSVSFLLFFFFFLFFFFLGLCLVVQKAAGPQLLGGTLRSLALPQEVYLAVGLCTQILDGEYRDIFPLSSGELALGSGWPNVHLV